MNQLLIFSQSCYSLKCVAASADLGFETAIYETDLRSEEILRRLETLVPWGRVPALVLSDGSTIVESANVVEFMVISTNRSESRYGPGQLGREVRYVERVADLYLSAPLGRIFHQSEGWEPPNESVTRAARIQIAETIAWAENRLRGHSWIVCERLSAADYAWGTALHLATQPPWSIPLSKPASSYLERWMNHFGIGALFGLGARYEAWLPQGRNRPNVDA